jgi:hypothetical protein
MPLSPRHWRARHLLGAWIAYWAVLLAVTLGPFAVAVRRIKGAPKNTSSASFSLGDQGLQGKVTSYGQTLWSVHAGVGEVVLWLVVPPLLIWLLWLALRPRAGTGEAATGPATRPRRELGAGAADWEPPAPAGRAEPQGERQRARGGEASTS